MDERPTIPSEYRKGRVKIFSCESGFTVKMRKMPVPVMAEMLTKLGLEVPAGIPLEQAEKLLKDRMKDPKFSRKVIDAATYVIPHVVVEPKIVEGDKYEEDSLSVNEIDPPDLFEIYEECVDFSGLAGAAAKMRKKFRGKQSRKSGGSSSN